ncbi:MAG: hypothetical protein C4527_18995 [Candidatus Omnitrophota bacterium]|jgi:hypothetical protein|nr:MAG: hypothetical protein C4527_18995 [Candidatus Omnitrophota bacterium]
MRRFLIEFTTVHLILGCLWMHSLSCQAAETYLLRNKFQEGDSAYLIIDSTVETVTTEDDKQALAFHGMKTVMSYRTMMIDRTQRATIKIGIEELKITGRNPVNLKELFKIGDEKITLKITPSGEVHEFTPPPSLATTNGPGESSSQQNPWLKFPEEPIRLGDSWTDSRVVPYPGASEPVIASTTYTLDAIEQKEGRSMAKIATQTLIRAKNVTVDPGEEQQGMVNMKLKYTFREFTMDAAGKLEFDMDAGRIDQFESTSTMVMDLAVEADIDQENFPNTFIKQSSVETRGQYAKEYKTP